MAFMLIYCWALQLRKRPLRQHAFTCNHREGGGLVVHRSENMLLWKGGFERGRHPVIPRSTSAVARQIPLLAGVTLQGDDIAQGLGGGGTQTGEAAGHLRDAPKPGRC